MDAAPVQTFQKSPELGGGKPHHTVLDPRPLEAALLELLGHEAQSRAVPPDQLDPVRALRSENVNHARERIAAILSADQRRQGLGALSKIHRTRRHHHPRSCAGSNHRVALSASITAAMTPASAPRPIFTATPSISSSTMLALERRGFRVRLARTGALAAGQSPRGQTTALAPLQ